MKARLVKFGEIEVQGERYTHDVVIDGGKVRKRKKGPSKQFREEFGHTPLSAAEEIPWGCKRLLVGTGANGALPPSCIAHADWSWETERARSQCRSEPALLS